MRVFGTFFLCSSVGAVSDPDSLSLLQLSTRALQPDNLNNGAVNVDNKAQAAEAWKKMNAEAMAKSEHSVAEDVLETGVADADFCSYLTQSVQEQAKGGGQTVSEWPDECERPGGVDLAQDASVNVRLVPLATAEGVQSAWDALPLSGILVVQDMISQPAEARKLIWQSIHQVNSRLYMEGAPLKPDQIGLPQLKYLGFFGNRAVLQKGSNATVSQQYPDGGQSPTETERAMGDFRRLAGLAGTDKIDSIHNYEMLYHRVLDTFPPKEGMMLEIGLGCTMDYGAGASAKIWPKLFPHMAVHFIELDAECTQKWLPKMKEIGVSDVHVGSQADPVVLEGVITAAQKTPGGLQIVIDDGSHQCEHIEASFRELFSHVRSGGLYIVEDMMYSGWGTPWGAKQASAFADKYHETEATPMALAAVLATSAVGVPKSFNFPATTWEQNILSDFGPQARAVECTPGVCGFRHV